MATQTVKFLSPGTPATVKLLEKDSDTVITNGTGASITQGSNAKNSWTAQFTDATAGTWRVVANDTDGNQLAEWYVAITATTATFLAYEPVNVQVSESIDSQISALINPFILQSTTIATLASQTSFTLTAGSTDDDAYNDASVVVVDQSTTTQKAVGYVADYTGSTKTVKLIEDPGIFTMAVGDTIHVVHGIAPAVVRIDASVTSSAGSACHISAWLDWRGKKIDITGATCSISFQELSQDAAAFTVTESDLLGSAAIEENVFRLLKSSPGFTDDRQYLVQATITHQGRAYQGTQMIPCLGGA